MASVSAWDGNPETGVQMSGTLTYYLDDVVPLGSATVIKDEFGDTLNRPITVGRHPLGFSGDNFDGLIYESRVSLGALEPSELLFGGSGSATDCINITSLSYDPGPDTPGGTVTWTSTPNTLYPVEYSTDPQTCSTATDATGAVGESTTTIVHELITSFPKFLDSKRLFYRVTEPIALPNPE